jgi:hypothetical protein
VTVRERASGPLPAPPETAAVGTAAIGHSVDDAAIDGVTLTFDVAASYLDDHGVDPANVTAYRRSGGEWSTVESVRADGPSGSVRYTVDSPGLSTFALAVDDPPDPPDGNESDDGTGDDGTVDNGTADNGTASGDEPTGKPRISVENVTVNRTTAAPNEAVGIDATLHNSGDGNGTYTAALRTIHGGNASLEATQRVTVAAGGRANVSYTTRFADPGNYTVSVNGTQAGPVTVENGGGPLSVLAFVPLRLLGLGVGGLVGLFVVGVLVRFVLRRVGGSGEEASG